MRIRFAVACLASIVAFGIGSNAARGDDETPKSVGLAFAQALSAGDAAGARALCVGVEKDFEFIDVVAAMMKTMRGMNDAAHAKFGDGAKDFGAVDPEALAKHVDLSDVKIDGNEATLSTPEDKTQLHMKKVEGKWKVDLGRMSDKDQFEKSAPMFRAIGQAAAQTTEEINAGKYKTAEDARRGFTANTMALSMGASATTAPVTTRPATMPAPVH